MIPLSLTIKNFVSYGPTSQTIDFGPYNLMCLSGKNGHGKSALLDALTWTIWGQARKISSVSKADEGLLRLGQTHMVITLDLIAQNIKYRIKREYNSYKNKSQARLEFGMVDSNTGHIRSLSDNTIKSTQQKIERYIGLNYETFVNSAFIKQGQSNEFSKKSPKERKDILGSILGLDRYELLKKQASDKAKEFIQEKNSLILYTERLNEDLQFQVNIKEEFNITQQKLNSLFDKEAQAKQDILIIKQEQEKISTIIKSYDKLFLQQEQYLDFLEESRNKFVTLVNNFRATRKEFSQLGNYKTLEKEREHIDQKLDIYNTKVQQKIKIQEDLFCLKEQKSRYNQELELNYKKRLDSFNENIHNSSLKLAHLDQRSQELLKLIDQYKQENNLLYNKQHNLKKLLSSTITPEKILKEAEQFEKRKTYYNNYKTRLTYVKEELSNIDQKANLICNTKKPSCPLCQQNLKETHKTNINKLLDKQKSFLSHRLNRLKNLISSLKKILLEQHNYLDKVYKQEEQQKIYKVQLQELYEQKEKIEHYIKSLLEKQNKLMPDFIREKELNLKLKEEKKTYQTAFESFLLNDKTYQTFISQEQSLEYKLKEHSYNPDFYNQLMEKRALIISKQEHYKSVLKEINLQDERKYLISSEGKVIKKLKIDLKAIEKKLTDYNATFTKQKDLKEQDNIITIKIYNIMQEKEQFLQKKGALEEQQKTLDKKREELNTHQEKLKILTQEVEDYQAISTALSKDGIQALLIEQALPEIEQEANNLLARLTDNQAHLIIDSLKDLKSGKTKETLDIKISDSLGIRAYEMFSGGEAFRIDFALRIAISKLLARRSGAALQTLIIDEGFGSQDEEGLNHIMECIYKIQDDFAKIIVVSHLPTLKEQFPVHFLIQKGPQGSTVKVIENG